MPQSPVPSSLADLFTSDLPSPLKALAGIAVTAVEDVRDLPNRVMALPTSVITSIAAQSMKAQQQYAEWVAKGEQFLDSLRVPHSDTPPWATFDEDASASRANTPAPSGIGPGSAFDRLPSVPADPTGGELVEVLDEELDDDVEPAMPRSPAPVKKAAPAKKSAPAKKAAPAKKSAPAKAGAKKTAAKKSAATPSAAKRSNAHAAAREAGQDAATHEPVMAEPLVTGEPVVADVQGGTQSGGSAPQSLPDFDTLTIPQLRSRLRTLKSAELDELIAHEIAHANRAAVVQMLRARLETLQK